MKSPPRIPAGFKGQHLVVLPGSVRKSAERHPLLRGLLVTDAGTFPHAAGHYVERPAGTPTALLIVCLAGRGWVRIGGRRHVLEPGSLAWLPEKIPHSYGADPESPWTIEWVHFTGEESAAWRELSGVAEEGGVLRLEAAAAGELNLGQVWPHLERGYTIANLVAGATALRTFLSGLVQRQPRTAVQARAAPERVAATARWMKEHLAQPARLDGLAALAGVSVPHYSALFRQQTGFAPIDFFIRLRIQRACQLLDTTPATVAEIGREVGFADAYYFTRCFRRVMSSSPREYRRVPKG